jgi:hypothetical protein
MRSIGKAVEAKLVAQGSEEAVALWRKLWALHEQGGAEAVESGLRELEAAEPDGTAAPEEP